MLRRSQRDRPPQHRGNPPITLGGCRGRASTAATRSWRRSTARSTRSRAAGGGCSRCAARPASARRVCWPSCASGRGAALRRAGGPRDRARAATSRSCRSIDALEPRLPDADALATLGRRAPGPARRGLPGVAAAPAPRRRQRALAPAPSARRAARADRRRPAAAAARRRRALGRPGDARAAGAPGAPPARRFAAARAAARARARRPSGCSPRSAPAAASGSWRSTSAAGARGRRGAARPCLRPAERDRLLRAVRRQPAAAARARPRRRRATPFPAGSSRRSAAEVSALPGRRAGAGPGAAVAGDPFDLDLAARIAGLDEAAALAALDVLAERGPRAGDRRPAALRVPSPGRAHARSTRRSARARGSRVTPRPRASSRARARRSTDRAQHLAHAASARRRRRRPRRCARRPRSVRGPGAGRRRGLAACRRRADPAAAEPVVARRDARRGRARWSPRWRWSTRPDAQVPTRGWPWPARASSGCSAATTRRAGGCCGRSTRPGPAARARRACWPTRRGRLPARRSTPRCATGRSRSSTPARRGAVRAASATLLAVGDAFAGEPTRPPRASPRRSPRWQTPSDDELGGRGRARRWRSPGACSRSIACPTGSAVARRHRGRRARAPATGWRRSRTTSRPCSRSGLLGRVDGGRAGRRRGRAGGARQRQPAAPAVGAVAAGLGTDGARAPRRGARGRAESVALAGELDDSASGVVARAVLGAVLGARGEHARAATLLAAYDIDHGWICRWAPLLVESDLALGDLAAAREHASAPPHLPRGREWRARGRRRPCPGARGAGRRATPRARPRSRWARRPRRQAPALRSRSRATGSSPGARCWPPTATAAMAELTAAAEQAARCGAPRVADEARLELRRAGVRVGRGGAARRRGYGPRCAEPA